MSGWRYEAVDAAGRKKRGTLSADTLRRARKEIQNAGLTPISIKSAQERTGGKTDLRLRGVPPSDVIGATRQLATLIDASMPVEEALSAVGTQMKSSPISAQLLSVRARIIEGWRLSDALAEHPKTFNGLYCGIVAAGQASGNLGPVMLRLADMQEKNRAMMMKAITSLIYPAAILVVAVMVVWALMRFVVPKIVDQISGAGQDLPWITDLVIAASAFLGQWGWLLALAFVASIAGIILARRRPSTKRALDQFVLKLPIMGPLARDLDAARFSRTLATLFASGTPLLDSLKSSQRTVTNSYIRHRLDGMMTQVREGAALSAAIRRADVFPPMMASMIAAGERSGALPSLLEKTALQMEQTFDTVVTTALRLLEPAVIVLLGVVVLVIVLAIMLPILQINSMAV